MQQAQVNLSTPLGVCWVEMLMVYKLSPGLNQLNYTSVLNLKPHFSGGTRWQHDTTQYNIRICLNMIFFLYLVKLWHVYFP